MANMRIVVLGAGFAGLRCAEVLEKFFPGQVTLIDKNDYHLYTPLLYELDEAKVKLPIRTKANFLKQEVGDWRQLDYDYLVLATGAEVNYCGIPGLEKNALAFKTLRDIQKLKEIPAGEILIIGGGATGAELAAELAIKLIGEKITIIDAASNILTNLSEKLRKKAEKRLKSLGIEIMCGRRLKEVKDKTVFFDNGEAMAFNNLIWTGGVKLGQYKVDEFLQVVGENNVFAVGDCASANPGLIRPGLWQAELAAKNIKRSIEGKKLASYAPKTLGVVVPLGGCYALAEIGIIKLAGLSAWLIKKIINFLYKRTYG